MDDFREFLMMGFKDAIGKKPVWWIVNNSNGYYEKGILTEEDLAELKNLIKTHLTSTGEYDGVSPIVLPVDIEKRLSGIESSLKNTSASLETTMQALDYLFMKDDTQSVSE